MLLALGCFGAVAGEPEAIRIPAHPEDRRNGTPAELDAAIWRQSAPGPHPAIVLLHGCSGLRDTKGKLAARDADWGARLAARGYVVLHIDSFAPRGERSLCSQSAERRIRQSVERARDSYAALMYLQSQANVRSDAIILMGWSNGGGTVLWTLSEGSRARPKGLTQDFAAGVSFYPGCRSISQRKDPWRPVAPVLLLVGEADDWTPAAPCVLLAERTGSLLELKIYPGAYHDFDAPDTKIRVRKDVGTTATGTATIGTDPAARADALSRVPDFLARFAVSR